MSSADTSKGISPAGPAARKEAYQSSSHQCSAGGALRVATLGIEEAARQLDGHLKAKELSETAYIALRQEIEMKRLEATNALQGLWDLVGKP